MRLRKVNRVTQILLDYYYCAISADPLHPLHESILIIEEVKFNDDHYKCHSQSNVFIRYCHLRSLHLHLLTQCTAVAGCSVHCTLTTPTLTKNIFQYCHIRAVSHSCYLLLITFLSVCKLQDVFLIISLLYFFYPVVPYSSVSVNCISHIPKD